MRYLEGHGNVSGRSEQANPLSITISIASRRLAHLSVAAEKNSVKPRPSIFKTLPDWRPAAQPLRTPYDWRALADARRSGRELDSVL
jgi:hypothetical protein